MYEKIEGGFGTFLGFLGVIGFDEKETEEES